MLKKILASYGISPAAIIQPHGGGLIHSTWKVSDQSNDYILQKINHEVFKQPEYIASNIEAISSWLKKNHPEYFFVTPIETKNNGSLLQVPREGYFRLFPFVKNSLTYDIAQTPQQAFEAARQFGLFTSILKDFPVENLKMTLPDFHNLTYRYDQFENAIQHGNPSRIEETKKTINFLCSHHHIVSTYQQIISNKEFKIRVTHHDTKISNVLFDKNGKGICVIDLDTVMPGYFISDVGDMMRTYLSPVSEEEKDFHKISIRDNFFHAIARGYLQEMATELSFTELQHFVYAGMFMIYMQALRFLTDYLNNDIYYGSLYEGHNYTRAKNQVVLLERLIEKKDKLSEMVMLVNPNSH
ncbi:MAG TPA: aminoglycoside phosphotransferase family protein [Chitinophagaceae bacterium]|jgi:Ser/Thr protein kinase RdoA (MazF antagonist)|nr:aminoglycoside phosphotransferase family protein [Chitinophagaceae bacterium]